MLGPMVDRIQLAASLEVLVGPQVRVAVVAAAAQVPAARVVQELVVRGAASQRQTIQVLVEAEVAVLEEQAVMVAAD